jgi:hypothetical protein
LASILNGPDEVQEKPVVPTTATHWYRPLLPVLAPARTLQRYSSPTLLVTSPDLSKLYGANEAKMPQSVVFEAQGEEFV